MHAAGCDFCSDTVDNPVVQNSSQAKPYPSCYRIWLHPCDTLSHVDGRKPRATSESLEVSSKRQFRARGRALVAVLIPGSKSGQPLCCYIEHQDVLAQKLHGRTNLAPAWPVISAEQPLLLA